METTTISQPSLPTNWTSWETIFQGTLWTAAWHIRQMLHYRSFRSSSSVSSSRGSLAAAVVAPFNYTPSSSSSANGGLERIKSAAQIKRNSSYVSSMGRRQEGGVGDVSPEEEEEEAERRGKKTPTGAAPSPMVYAGNTSSSVVTLV